MRLFRVAVIVAIVAMMCTAAPAAAQYVDTGDAPVVGTSDTGAQSTEAEVQGVEFERTLPDDASDAFSMELGWPYLYLTLGLLILFLLLWRRPRDEPAKGASA